MSDNVPITPGAGANIAADDIGGVMHQRVKMEFGAEGSATDVSPASPLPVTAPSDFPDAAGLAKLEAIRAALVSGIPVSGAFWQTTQPVSVSALPLPTGASTETTLAQAVAALASIQTEIQAKTEPADTQVVASVDLSLLERIAIKVLAKMTFNTAGLRVDASGATITANIAASQTLANVTALGSASNVALGRTTPDGQGIQQSVAAFQLGFRRNLTWS